jgi:alpha-tubulin suppressor-like RCC1 family protein
VFGCGYQGFSVPESSSINEEYMEKSKFKLIQIDGRIISVSCGLSGSVALSQEGQAYVWGRFGKLIYNIPKKVSNKALDNILSRN